tara:strand:- start:946 stop:1563 length:618 start_codon:yes stop_codon:yes gene_type:complete
MWGETVKLDAALNFTMTSGNASLAVVPFGGKLLGPSTKSTIRRGSVAVVAGVLPSSAFFDLPKVVLPAVTTTAAFNPRSVVFIASSACIWIRTNGSSSTYAIASVAALSAGQKFENVFCLLVGSVYEQPMKIPTAPSAVVPVFLIIVPSVWTETKSPLEIRVSYVVIIGKCLVLLVNDPEPLRVPMGLAPYGAAVVAIIVFPYNS